MRPFLSLIQGIEQAPQVDNRQKTNVALLAGPGYGTAEMPTEMSTHSEENVESAARVADFQGTTRAQPSALSDSEQRSGSCR